MKGLLTVAAVAVYGLGQGPRGPFAAAAKADAQQQQQQQQNGTGPLGFEEFMAAGGFDEDGDWEEDEGSSNNDESNTNNTPALRFSMQQLRDAAEAAAQKVASLLFTGEGDNISREETAGRNVSPGRGDIGWPRAGIEEEGPVPRLNAISAVAKDALAAAVAATQQQADALTSSVTAAKERAQREFEKVYEDIQAKMGTVIAAAADTPVGRDIQHLLHLLEKGQPLSPSDPAVKRCVQGLSWAGTLLAVAAATAAGGDTKGGAASILQAIMSLVPRVDIEISSNGQKPLRSSKKRRRRNKERQPNKKLEMLQQMLLEELRQHPNSDAETFLEKLVKEAQQREGEETGGPQEPENSLYDTRDASKQQEKRYGRNLRRHHHHRQRGPPFNKEGGDVSKP